jgi:ribokinase
MQRRFAPTVRLRNSKRAEACALTGMQVDTMTKIERAAAALLERGARHVVLTLGARGAFVLGRHVAEHVEAFQIGAVVDTTGAGDAFNGAFAVGLAEGMSVLDATRFGCAAAGLSVTRPGTATSMPEREEVERHLSRSRRGGHPQSDG